MNSSNLRVVESFQNQVNHLSQRGIHTESRRVGTLVTGMNAFARRLMQLHRKVYKADLEAKKATTVDQWRTWLRVKSLLPLRSDARLYLNLNLRVPHKKATNQTLIAAALEFEQVLRPHLQTLIENGVDDDCLDVLVYHREQFTLWATQQTRSSEQLKHLRDQEKAELARARKHARSLHSAVAAHLVTNPSALTEWNHARRIPKKVGPTRDTGGHLVTAKRRRRKPDFRGEPPEFEGTDSPA